METENYRIVIVQIRNTIAEKEKEKLPLTITERTIANIADSIIHTKINEDADAIANSSIEKINSILKWRYIRKVIKSISENVFFVKAEAVCQTTRKVRKGDLVLARRIIAKIITEDMDLLTDVQMGIQLGHLDASSVNCGIRRINELLNIDKQVQDYYSRAKFEIEKLGTFADFVKINTFA